MGNVIIAMKGHASHPAHTLEV